jgi:hypothetical protein
VRDDGLDLEAVLGACGAGLREREETEVLGEAALGLEPLRANDLVDGA